MKNKKWDYQLQLDFFFGIGIGYTYDIITVSEIVKVRAHSIIFPFFKISFITPQKVLKEYINSLHIIDEN